MHPDAVLEDAEAGVWKLYCKCEEPCCQWRCTGCGNRWKDAPGHRQCLACGSLYVEWVNYAKWRKAHRHVDCGVPRCPMA